MWLTRLINIMSESEKTLIILTFVAIGAIQRLNGDLLSQFMDLSFRFCYQFLLFEFFVLYGLFLTD